MAPITIVKAAKLAAEVTATIGPGCASPSSTNTLAKTWLITATSMPVTVATGAILDMNLCRGTARRQKACTRTTTRRLRRRKISVKTLTPSTRVPTRIESSCAATSTSSHELPTGQAKRLDRQSAANSPWSSRPTLAQRLARALSAETRLTRWTRPPKHCSTSAANCKEATKSISRRSDALTLRWTSRFVGMLRASRQSRARRLFGSFGMNFAASNSILTAISNLSRCIKKGFRTSLTQSRLHPRLEPHNGRPALWMSLQTKQLIWSEYSPKIFRHS